MSGLISNHPLPEQRYFLKDMNNVKRIFFLTKEECRKIDGFVYSEAPHYELEDGTMMYAKHGFPGGGETWWEEINPEKSPQE